MVESFEKLLKEVIENISKGVENILSYLDKKVFINLINCLKYEDEMAVNNALNQLIEEKNKLAIAPIYLASKRHPSFRVRKLCKDALSQIDNINKIEEITTGKDDREAIKKLIETYGHYRYDNN